MGSSRCFHQVFFPNYGFSAEQARFANGVLLSIVLYPPSLPYRSVSVSRPPPATILARVSFTELESLQELVRSVRLILSGENGVLSDDYFFPLVVGGERVVIFRRGVYEALFKGIREKFGTAGEVMLYYVGFNIGYQAYSDYAA